MCRDDMWKSPVASEMVVGCGLSEFHSGRELSRIATHGVGQEA